MKYYYLICCICFFFTACTPEFNLNAPYKDVTVVYGILNHQDSIHYVKIYKGFQTREKGSVFINAQNPDSIYYNVDEIEVVLQEFENEKRTSRPEILLKATSDFSRDSGIFYYGDERILYFTAEPILQEKIYKIVITNKRTGQIVEGKTTIVEDFKISMFSQSISMITTPFAEFMLTFIPANQAADYEFHLNFLYFEVNKETNKVVKTEKLERIISSRIGEILRIDNLGNLEKKLPKIFLDLIATKIKKDDSVIRYMGSPKPGDNGKCIEIEVWAAGESMAKFLLSNAPTSSFAQISDIYTNMSAHNSDKSEGLAFGVFSSRAKTTSFFTTDISSQDSLVSGSKTGHLGFRPWVEYKP
jgi:hypothetical protein